MERVIEPSLTAKPLGRLLQHIGWSYKEMEEMMVGMVEMVVEMKVMI